jgi:hypothetical protein
MDLRPVTVAISGAHLGQCRRYREFMPKQTVAPLGVSGTGFLPSHYH